MTLKLSTGNPSELGTYVCYCRGMELPNDTVTVRRELFWDGRWSYSASAEDYRDSDDIIGWIGPLPPLLLSRIKIKRNKT